jgi:hypothetical protein
MALYPNQTTSRKLTTAKLWLKPAGETTYFDVGTILGYKWTADRKSATFDSSQPGFRRTEQERTIEQGCKFTFNCNEHFADIFKLCAGSEQQADFVQSIVTAPAGTLTFTGIYGASYWTGAFFIDNVVVKHGEVTQVEGVTYDVDYAAGMITHKFADNQVVAVTFGNAAVTMNDHLVNKVATVTCDFKLCEYDQETNSLFQETTGSGRVWISASPENDGSKYSEYELTMRVVGRPVINTRLL